MPASEAVLTIVPFSPAARKWRTASRLERNTPLAFTAMLESPFLLGEVDHRVHGRNARIGGEQIEAAHPLGGGAEDGRGLRRVGDVEPVGARAVAEALGEFASPIEADVADRNERPFSGEGLCDGAPDASGRARDEGPPPGEQSATLVHDAFTPVACRTAMVSRAVPAGRRLRGFSQYRPRFTDTASPGFWPHGERGEKLTQCRGDGARARAREHAGTRAVPGCCRSRSRRTARRRRPAIPHPRPGLGLADEPDAAAHLDRVRIDDLDFAVVGLTVSGVVDLAVFPLAVALVPPCPTASGCPGAAACEATCLRFSRRASACRPCRWGA